MHPDDFSLLLQSSIDTTIVVPCFNEEEFITTTLECIQSAAESIGMSYEVIVIDDESRDRTYEVAENYRQAHPEMPLIVKRNEKNRGLSRTFCDGAFLGKGRYYRLVCGDNSETADSLRKIFEMRGTADIILPYHPTVPGKSAIRRKISKLYTAIINSITGYNLKYYNGCPLFYRLDVMRWGSYSFGFGFQADLLTRLLDEGRSYLEIPVEVYHHENDAGASAFRIRNVLSVLHTISELMVRRLRRHV